MLQGLVNGATRETGKTQVADDRQLLRQAIVVATQALEDFITVLDKKQDTEEYHAELQAEIQRAAAAADLFKEFLSQKVRLCRRKTMPMKRSPSTRTSRTRSPRRCPSAASLARVPARQSRMVLAFLFPGHHPASS